MSCFNNTATIVSWICSGGLCSNLQWKQDATDLLGQQTSVFASEDAKLAFENVRRQVTLSDNVQVRVYNHKDAILSRIINGENAFEILKSYEENK